MKTRRWLIQIVPSVDHRDRWLLVKRGTIEDAWSAPRWLSPVSWWMWFAHRPEMLRRR